MKDNNKTTNIPYATRSELIIAVALGCLNIAIFALLANVWKYDIIFLTLAVLLVYLCEIVILGIKHKSKAEIANSPDVHSLLMQKSSTVLRDTTTPIVLFDSFGTVLWCNTAMRELLTDAVNPISRNILDVFGAGIDLDANEQHPFVFADRIFTLESFTLSDTDDGIYMISFLDITSLCEYKEKYNNERTAVAYITIDNVEDVLQYVHEKFSDAVSKVEEKLKAWADSIDGILKSYDSDKYIMLFDSVHLNALIKDRFAILDEIRDTRVGDGVSVTVSIGVSCVSGPLSLRESNARDAVDMALQRGGDQAVYKSEEAIEYYGGRTKSVYKRSNVRSRAFTAQLMSNMARADNVIIMGHRYGDFDSFGASIGIARLASLCGTKANIAIDLRDRNLMHCITLMQNLNEYSQTFVDSAEALDLVGPDTVVVVVDVNNLARAQFSSVAEKVATVAVIDHHRKTVELPESVTLSYIDPSASSACELIGEMLESAISSQSLLKEEADMLLAGILLDTKQFTRNTGTRTFAVAQYLRGAGADPSDVYDFFKTTTAELSKEARFHTAITTYRDRFAISACDGETDESYRVIASKAADKMLTLQGIDAAFTLVRIGEQIHISGRSSGSVNVQLILEKLGGGGHYDVAGAQVLSDSVISVLESLKASIDDYIES